MEYDALRINFVRSFFNLIQSFIIIFTLLRFYNVLLSDKFDGSLYRFLKPIYKNLYKILFYKNWK